MANSNTLVNARRHSFRDGPERTCNWLFKVFKKGVDGCIYEIPKWQKYLS